MDDYAKEIGDEGEAKVRAAIESLAGDGRFHLHDLLLDLGRTTAQLDHVVVDRFGILMVETKSYDALIRGTSGERFWTACYAGGKTHRMLNPLEQNEKHREKLHKALSAAGNPVASNFIQSVIVFTRGNMQHLDLTIEDRERVVDVDEVAEFILRREDFQPNHGMSLDEAKRLWGLLRALDKSSSEEVQAKHDRTVAKASGRGSKRRKSGTSTQSSAYQARPGSYTPPPPIGYSSAPQHYRPRQASPSVEIEISRSTIVACIVGAIVVLIFVVNVMPTLVSRWFLSGAGTNGAETAPTPVLREPQPSVPYDSALALRRIAELDATLPSALVDPEHPKLGVTRRLPSYTWQYLVRRPGKKAVEVRTLTITLGENGQIVGVDED